MKNNNKNTSYTTPTMAKRVPKIEFLGSKIIQLINPTLSGESLSGFNPDLPEQTITGRNFIELIFKDPDGNPKKIFKSEFYPQELRSFGAHGLRTFDTPGSVNLEYIGRAMQDGFADISLFPHVGTYAGTLRSVVKTDNTYETISNLPLNPKLVKLQPEDIFAALKAHKSLMIYRSSVSGQLDYEFINSSLGKGDAGLVSLKRSSTRRFAITDNPDISFTSPADGDILYGPRGFPISTEGFVKLHISGIISVKVQLGSDPPIDAQYQALADFNGIVFWARVPAIIEGPQTLTVIVKYSFDPPQEQEMKDSINITISFDVLPTDEVTLPLPNDKIPRLFLIERYQLSSYLGLYGAGRTLKTFTLLPGEKTKISTRTYMKTEEQRKSSSSVLDSVTDESTKDFENSVGTEQSNKSSYQESFSYEVNAQAEASWGFGSAEVSGGVKGGSNSSREEFAKNISNATQKHSSKASAKREVEINTSYEKTVQTETEASMEREIQNINVSSTLNFVFRQMNQEFIAILHLVDIRVAFWDGDSNPITSKRIEVPLSQLNSGLLQKVLVDENEDPNAITIHKEVHKAIIEEIENIQDYDYKNVEIDENNQELFIVKVEGVEPSPEPEDPIMTRNYYRINKKYRSRYSDGPTNINNIPGIILAVNKHILRTDGVIVESILGEGKALDNYSESLQNASIRAKELENQLKETEIRKNRLAINTVDKGPKEQVERFKQIYPCCKPTIFSLWPREEEDTLTEEEQ